MSLLVRCGVVTPELSTSYRDLLASWFVHCRLSFVNSLSALDSSSLSSSTRRSCAARTVRNVAESSGETSSFGGVVSPTDEEEGVAGEWFRGGGS